MAKLSKKEKEQKREEVKKVLNGFFDENLVNHLVEKVFIKSATVGLFENSLGALILGRMMGHRALWLVHSRVSLNKYQKYLELDFRGKLPWDETQNVMEEVGPVAYASLAFRISEEIGEFWRIIRGEEKIPRDEKELLDGSEVIA